MRCEEERERAAEGAGGTGNGLVTDGNGLAEGRLGLVDSLKLDERIAEISEMDALIVLVADCSSDGEGLGEMRDGWVVLALALVDES